MQLLHAPSVPCYIIFCHEIEAFCFLLRYNKSVAQLLIRWCLERGFVCIPKSVKEQRIVENGDVFDFKISDEDMQVLVRSVICSLS